MTRTSMLSFLLMLSCGAIVFGVRAHGVARPGAAGSAVLNPVVSPPLRTTGQSSPTAQSGPVQVVRFALYDVGIYPHEVHANKGLVAITFEDLSGGASDLVVERDTGAAPESVGRVLRTDRNARGRNDLRLEPGRYELFVASHPENRATLIVEP